MVGSSILTIMRGASMFNPLKALREGFYSIADGMSRILEIYPTTPTRVLKFKRRSPEDDWANLNRDRLKIEDDLMKAFKKYTEEQDDE